MRPLTFGPEAGFYMKMSQSAFLSHNSLAAHAVCMAAGVRDSLRATQFYARDLARADGKQSAPFLSRMVASVARLTDTLMNRGARVLIAIFLPSWRNLPSPFSAGVINEVAAAINRNSFRNNPRFNAYFFRAANHILDHYCEGPNLVLEHRVDAARRHLASQEDASADVSQFLPRTLIALTRHGAIARNGQMKPGQQFFGSVDANVAVFAISCVALMLASEGKPTDAMDENEFFEVTGALIGPRLRAIADYVDASNVKALAAELASIRAMY
jgi:hypothetical protein